MDSKVTCIICSNGNTLRYDVKKSIANMLIKKFEDNKEEKEVVSFNVEDVIDTNVYINIKNIDAIRVQPAII